MSMKIASAAALLGLSLSSVAQAQEIARAARYPATGFHFS